ncbi:hypothetical protein RirG_271650 [Rhizophagus irregularis DAOM 197198w]|uniref:BTB domain-containing protein n=1 Tax=Rhizophagus irregularis (strain DAOM 197198w) TaxID=1432141 RepID=A0A015I975_RHIIW|nr:hypothetical protein RirG_271650 [Rhizophagus irregularis DAOM 197198w]
MTRGYSLEQDLSLLINNTKYSDIEILCEDGKKLYGCRAILAARSELFDSLLYNGMKESFENKISFPKINSSGMKIILEYIYTGLIKKESLNKNNIIEAFYAADFFQLTALQENIVRVVNNTLESENYSPELLSNIVEIMPFIEDNILQNLLVEKVATIPLNTIEFDRLSIAGLQCLLSFTHKKAKSFATPEYEVFRYSAILAAKQVSNDAFKTLMKCLPTLEQIKNSIQVENEPITDHCKVTKELEPLIDFIDFNQIKGKILTDIIEPLGIIPAKTILDAYRQKARSHNTDFNEIRGTQFWDELACGSKLFIEENGKVVSASNDCHTHQGVRAKILIDSKGIFEWDFIIEKACKWFWVGVCAPGSFNNDEPIGWALSSEGRYYNSGNYLEDYCPSLGDGTRITVHLDMNKKTCAFTVDGTRYPEVLNCNNNLPSKFYPVASLCYPGRFRIQSHQKLDVII